MSQPHQALTERITDWNDTHVLTYLCHVLVKFSPSGADAVSRRWADLLVSEGGPPTCDVWSADRQGLQLSASTVWLQHDNVETVNATGSLQALAILKRTAQYLFGLGLAAGDDGSPADEQRRLFQFHNSSSHRVAAASDILN